MFPSGLSPVSETKGLKWGGGLRRYHHVKKQGCFQNLKKNNKNNLEIICGFFKDEEML